MKLKKGDKLPAFEVSDISGHGISSKKLKGKKTLIIFFRYSSCILCHLRIQKLVQTKDKWSDKLQIIGVFQSPKSSIKKYVKKVPFKVVADPKRNLYRMFSVTTSFFGVLKAALSLKALKALVLHPLMVFGKKEGRMDSNPANFLVDKNGIIKIAYYGSDISDHIPFERIERFIS